ncbi:RNA polymerase sigma factor [Kaistia algarum]|uniref:RNA polymerase sigma factor n=1 Tax=Kaistia algarum TaxID=2083279 RepID=UPI00224EF290|nr:RNA polymerase sigma factor [Kaistia algarum]MCX5515420.1 RNA polymerase sigma factor [Kaistia algarum]
MTFAAGSTQPEDAQLAPANASSLLERARGGDARAFAGLVETHYGFIFATAFKWCGNRPDAEDVAQDVCLKLGEAIRSFDARSGFTTWLYRVTLNAVRDLQRAQSRTARHASAYALVSPDEDPGDQEANVAVVDLWRAVRALPPKQRDAVLLVYAEELSHAEAAVILECREATVSWHVHEARKTLRGLL